MFEDPLTADFPSRLAREDEEEAAAQQDQGVFDELPSLLWSPAGERLLSGTGELRVRLLVLATSPSSCALLQAAPGLGKALGSLVLEDIALTGNTLVPSPTDQSCWIHSLGGGRDGKAGGPTDEAHHMATGPTEGIEPLGTGGLEPHGAGGRDPPECLPGEGSAGAESRGVGGGGGGGVGTVGTAGAASSNGGVPGETGPGVDCVAVLCRYQVPPERAFAAAQGLLLRLKPQRALILADIPVWTNPLKNRSMLPSTHPAVNDGKLWISSIHSSINPPILPSIHP
eukprot:jgi/Botrbrau1/20832/Bobra.0156s0057.1